MPGRRGPRRWTRLARRDHASEDLRRKLREKGYDAAVVDELIERLRAEKLLDDRRYLRELRGLSRRARPGAQSRARRACASSGCERRRSESCLDAYPDWIAQLKRARAKEVWNFAADQLR